MQITPRLKAVLAIMIVVLAAVAGGYYYWETRPVREFNLSISPQFFHVGQREGKLVNASITRSPGFSGQVTVSLLNPPSWVVTAPQTISAAQTNATVPVIAAYNAPKGSVQLTIVATSPGAVDQSAQVEMKVVSVQQFSSRNGNATIYETTKSLDNDTKRALVHYSNGMLTFSHETPLLQTLARGDVLTAGPSPPVAPLGFFRLVLSVSQSNGSVVVQTTHAGILDAVQEIHVHTGSGGAGGSSGSLGVTCDFCTGDNIPIIPETTLTPPGLPLDWGAIKAGASVSFGAGVDYRLDVSLHWPDWTQIAQAAVCFAAGGLALAIACGIARVDDAHFFINANAGAEGDITGTPGQVNSGPTDLISTQDCSAQQTPNSIVCLPPIVLFTIGPVSITAGFGFHFVGGATGALTSNMYVKVQQTLSVSLGPEYTKQNGFDLKHEVTHTATDDAHLDTAAGSNDVKLYAGPEVVVAVDAGSGPISLSVGLNVQLHAFLEFQSLIPHNPVWWVDGGLEGCVGVNVSAFLMGDWNPPDACGTIVSAQILQNQKPFPPNAPVITYPSDGATLDLSNPAFVNPSEWDFKADVLDPQGDSVTCVWTDSALGQIGQSTSPSPGGCDGQIDVSKISTGGISTLHVTATATNTDGLKSGPSSPVTVHILLPLPVLSIQFPTSTTTVYQNQAFTATGTATESTAVTSTNPNGVIDFCATAPQRLAWVVGGYYSPDMPGWIDQYNDPRTYGGGCNVQLTIPGTGPNTINFYILTGDLSDLEKDRNGNPIVITVTVNVQPQAPPPPPGTSAMSVAILTPSETSSSPPHTPTSNPTVQLQGSLTGGTAPYTVTWTGTWEGNSATIASGFKSSTLSYSWNVCTNGFPWSGFSSNGINLITVHLSATDSTNPQQHADSPSDIQINFNCVQLQTLPVFPVTGLVTLLTLIFTVTTERKTVLKNRLWPRMQRSLSCTLHP